MKKVITLVSILTLTGCVSITAEKPSHTETDSIVELLEKYRSASQAGLISPYKLTDPIGLTSSYRVESTPNYKSFSSWWCLDGNSSRYELENLAAEHCKKLSGTIKNHWCEDNNTQQPIYNILIGGADIVDPSAQCTGTPAIGVIAYESANNNQTGWLNYARNELGYVEYETLLEQREKAATQALIAAQQAAMQKETERNIQATLTLQADRGSQLCKKDKNAMNQDIIYIGFLEEKTDRRIKVSVAQAFMARTNRIIWQGPNHERWDDPALWYLCN